MFDKSTTFRINGLDNKNVTFSSDVFFFQKPTSTSKEERILTPNDFPNIFVFPQPGYDIDALILQDYFTPFWYYMGLNKDYKFIGWNGNTGSSMGNFTESIMMLKNTSVLPDLKLNIENEEMMIDAELSYSRIFFPYGKCLKVMKPESVKNKTIIDGFLLMKNLNNN